MRLFLWCSNTVLAWQFVICLLLMIFIFEILWPLASRHGSQHLLPSLQNLFSQLFEVQVWVVKRNKTKMESLNERISRSYNTFYTSFQSMTSAEDLLNIANDHPTTRRCVELYIKTDKILSKIMAVGFTFLIVPLTYCRDIMYFIFYLFLESIMQWIKINQ